MTLKYEIKGSTIRITEFEFNSTLLVERLKQVDPRDQDAYLSQAIEFGLSTLAAVSTQAEIRELESAAKRFRQDMVETKKEVIDGLKREFNDQLDDSSQVSLISVFKRSVLAGLKEDLSPESPNSPFAGLARSIDELLTALDRLQTRKSVEGKSPKKGNDFELDVDFLVKQVGAKHGDQVEFVGADGAGGRKSGDTLVTFNPQLSNLKKEFKVVWECKTERDFKTVSSGLLKPHKVNEELAKAISFREADCGIFVADSESLENQPEFQELNGNRLMLVLDRENPDIRLVTLAYLWSKGIAYRMNSHDRAFDFGKLDSLFTRLKTAVNSLSTLKAAHTEITQGLSSATKWVEREEKEFKSIVAEIENLIIESKEQSEEVGDE